MSHDTPAVTVTARQASRWRCGTEFTGTPQAFPAGHWSEEELERLRGDDLLVVAEGGAALEETGSDRDSAIARAAHAMETGKDPDAWTKNGAPQVAALEAVLGFGITAAERDAAWASCLASLGKELTG
ncbi:MAG: hypothetical protein OXH64_11540 [Rhodospirillaceae bacterium]|nr:hypothetical protein [Rhodospirillaceae bacterium]